MDLNARAKKLKTDIPAVFIAMKNKKTPPGAKLLAALTVVYALSPVDLIPDFIPVLGYLDDLIILPALIALTVKRIPPEVLRDCRAQAQGLWENGKPKRWYYAAPFFLLWAAVLLFLVRVFLR